MALNFTAGSVVFKKAAALVYPQFFFSGIMRPQMDFGPYCVISFDCDFPRDIEVLPRLVSLLKEYKVSASFACIGQWVRKYPDPHQLLVDEGFELLNHTHTHPNLFHPDYDYASGPELSRAFFNQISRSERKREIEQCHAAFTEVLGVSPVGFRTPHFGALHVDDVYELLAELGYVFSTSGLAAAHGGLPYRTEEGIWEIPVSPCPRHPFGVFDSWHSLGKSGASHGGEGELAGLFGELISCVANDGGLANVYFDPKDAVESGELERILRILVEAEVEAVDYCKLLDKIQVREGEALADVGGLKGC
jgi:peptidoglycan-N-acetylglucosamine deacetylase